MEVSVGANGRVGESVETVGHALVMVWIGSNYFQEVVSATTQNLTVS